jgi:hypothetical protein
MESRVMPEHLEYYTAMIWTWSVDFLPRFVTATLILIVGCLVAV